MPSPDPPRPPVPHLPAPESRQRRLSDKILIAFHAACDEGAVEIALRLLSQLDAVIRHPANLPGGVDRRQPESLVAARERVMNLMLWDDPKTSRHPE